MPTTSLEATPEVATANAATFAVTVPATTLAALRPAASASSIVR